MYLDPGFGGMLLQAVVAITAVGGGLVFSFRRKIRLFFSKGKVKPLSVHVPDTPDDAIDVLDNETK